MPSDPKLRDWQVPYAASADSDKLGWIDDQTGDGMAWLRSQGATQEEYRRAMDVISGRDAARNTQPYRSRVSTNHLKKNVRVVTGALAKLRPMWGYHSDNAAYKDQAETLNKVTRAWYLKSFADRKIKEALQYAAVLRRGWVRPVYLREMAGTGKGDIALLSYGAPCVLPSQLPASGDFQRAYAVTILDEMPVYMAHGMFPSRQHLLAPTASRYWYQSDAVRNTARGNVFTRMFAGLKRGVGLGDRSLDDLLCPIRYTYVNDLAMNTTSDPIPMGEPGATWSYTVPAIGSPIYVGKRKDGTSLYRKADENDARLYPYRRLLISSETGILYDGPGFDWHGKFPAVSFQVDAWPWEPLGFSLINDGYELQTAIDQIMRGNMDKVAAQLDPAMAYDMNAVARRDAINFDPLQPRGRMAYDGSAVEGTPMTQVMSPETLKVTPESMAMVEKLESMMDAQQAVADAMSLAKTRTVGSMDELEKLMEANGPIIEDLSRGMEPAMRDLGEMVKFDIFQYYDAARVMQIEGPENMSMVSFDFDPSSLVPSHVPGESPDDGDSALSKCQRAHILADNLQFMIMPGSLHEMTQMVQKLGLIQLRKAGVKISSQTIAEAWGIPNYGSMGGSTELEKWEAEQEKDLEFAARMKELAAAEGLVPPGGGGAGGGGGKPSGGPEGRPNSNTAPPKIQQKDSGTRSTISTSK